MAKALQIRSNLSDEYRADSKRAVSIAVGSITGFTVLVLVFLCAYCRRRSKRSCLRPKISSAEEGEICFQSSRSTSEGARGSQGRRKADEIKWWESFCGVRHGNRGGATTEMESVKIGQDSTKSMGYRSRYADPTILSNKGDKYPFGVGDRTRDDQQGSRGSPSADYHQTGRTASGEKYPRRGCRPRGKNGDSHRHDSNQRSVIDNSDHAENLAGHGRDDGWIHSPLHWLQPRHRKHSEHLSVPPSHSVHHPRDRSNRRRRQRRARSGLESESGSRPRSRSFSRPRNQLPCTSLPAFIPPIPHNRHRHHRQIPVSFQRDTRVDSGQSSNKKTGCTGPSPTTLSPNSSPATSPSLPTHLNLPFPTFPLQSHDSPYPPNSGEMISPGFNYSPYTPDSSITQYSLHPSGPLYPTNSLNIQNLPHEPHPAHPPHLGHSHDSDCPINPSNASISANPLDSINSPCHASHQVSRQYCAHHPNTQDTAYLSADCFNSSNSKMYTSSLLKDSHSGKVQDRMNGSITSSPPPSPVLSQGKSPEISIQIPSAQSSFVSPSFTTPSSPLVGEEEDDQECSLPPPLSTSIGEGIENLNSSPNIDPTHTITIIAQFRQSTEPSETADHSEYLGDTEIGNQDDLEDDKLSTCTCISSNVGNGGLSPTISIQDPHPGRLVDFLRTRPSSLQSPPSSTPPPSISSTPPASRSPKIWRQISAILRNPKRTTSKSNCAENRTSLGDGGDNFYPPSSFSPSAASPFSCLSSPPQSPSSLSRSSILSQSPSIRLTSTPPLPPSPHLEYSHPSFSANLPSPAVVEPDSSIFTSSSRPRIPRSKSTNNIPVPTRIARSSRHQKRRHQVHLNTISRRRTVSPSLSLSNDQHQYSKGLSGTRYRDVADKSKIEYAASDQPQLRDLRTTVETVADSGSDWGRTREKHL